jgi:hypothetical protein
VLADDDHEGGGEHGDYVDDEEEVGDAAGDCEGGGLAIGRSLYVSLFLFL